MSIDQGTEAGAIDAASEAMTGAEHDAVTGTPDGLLRAPHLSIATVCLSGTLEDKLSAAAAARFQGIEIFEPDLIASPWSPRQVRQECARRGLSIDVYQPFRDFEAVPPDMFEANLRRAERKFEVLEQLGVDTMLVTSSVSPDAVDDDDLAAEQLHELAARAERQRPAHRLRSAGVGQVRQHLRACVANRAARQPSRPRPVSGQLPRAVPRRRRRGNQGRARFQVVPRAAGRRAAAEHGRGGVEPTPPDVPGTGFVRSGRLRQPRTDHRIRRSVVARGIQRCLPAGRSPARRHRRDAFATRLAGGRLCPRPGGSP